ncbi:MAG TPA: hypothetical protein VMZ28_21415 [Kofleriaceae bacterium]|nr:hypothetical protein [Kofleriaceae bacterium]
MDRLSRGTEAEDMDEKARVLEEENERLRQAVRMARELLDRFADPYSEVWGRKQSLGYSLAANVVLELDEALAGGDIAAVGPSDTNPD